jgi:hypothetical protein
VLRVAFATLSPNEQQDTLYSISKIQTIITDTTVDRHKLREVEKLKNEMKVAQNVNVESLIDAFLALLEENLKDNFFSGQLTPHQIAGKLKGLDDRWNEQVKKAKLNK